MISESVATSAVMQSNKHSKCFTGNGDMPRTFLETSWKCIWRTFALVEIAKVLSQSPGNPATPATVSGLVALCQFKPALVSRAASIDFSGSKDFTRAACPCPTCCSSSPRVLRQGSISAQTTSTRPRSWARAAPIFSPVSIRCRKAESLTRLLHATETRAGSSPCRTSGKDIWESGCATTISARARNMAPPPCVSPWTATIITILVLDMNFCSLPNNEREFWNSSEERASAAPRQKLSVFEDVIVNVETLASSATNKALSSSFNTAGESKNLVPSAG